MLPGKNGESLISQRQESNSVPIIIVSAKDSLDSKVELLTRGADDYITKPFEIEELIARVGVQIRRFSSGNGNSGNFIRYMELTLDTDNYSLLINGSEVSLTRQEFRIMELLLSHPMRVFSKEDIYSYGWDDMYLGEDKTINVHVSNIRKKLKAFTEKEYIETVWGIGYRLSR